MRATEKAAAAKPIPQQYVLLLVGLISFALLLGMPVFTYTVAFLFGVTRQYFRGGGTMAAFTPLPSLPKAKTQE